MKTNSTHFYATLLCFTLLCFFCSCSQINTSDLEEKEGYDEPDQAALFQKMRTHDPATGEVPADRMWQGILQTEGLKEQVRNSSSLISALNWIERGSNSDAIGPSNGNTRANSAVTSGRIDALWVDRSDATGRTVWVGGRGGGLWKTTDITLSPATWTVVNDYMINLSIVGITQDPTNANIMYFCTGESFYESGALRGNGVFKSTDNGVTWSQLASTNNSTYFYCTRILCDYLGNIYVGTRSGLFRSTAASGGAAWTNITPTGVSTGVTDLEISSTSGPGRLHGLFGIQAALSSRYTDIPATVAVGTWTSPVTTLPSASIRAEMAVSGNTLYCIPSNSSSQVPTVYKSTDGGANWVTAGSTPVTATGGPFANGQGWYNLAVAINPSNANECIIGGIDNAKTSNGGTTWTRISDWVGTTGQYVHADQHASIWYDNGNKLLLAGDGGIFYSSNGGTTIRDRNVGLRIKQFYSVAVHPSSTNYFLTGAQDNGTHQFSNAGLSSSVEVFGGDGAFVAIDQNEPAFQTGSYVYSNYRRSTNSGVSWTFGPTDNNGLFINPYDYDNVGNRVYSSYTTGNFLRWENPQTGFTYTTVPVAAFTGQVGAVCVSPYTANRVYFGMASGGRIIRVDGADAASPTGVNITGVSMPTSSVFMNCINVGSSDQFLVACYSNFGVQNIWVSSNGGTSWTNIDGNLPDIPVYSAIYHPDNNSKMIIATETGVWETDLINGSSTVWTANTSFPTARATMLKYRSSDRTIAASSYGRGLWTTVIPSVTTPDIQFQVSMASATESTSFSGACRGYSDYSFNMNILNAPTGNATVTLSVAGGATATPGVDYVFTTNGNFVTPGTTLTFASGLTTPQPFTIRVYDDAAVESAETFTLTYGISGATNAQAGSSNQSFSFTINDNDAGPIAPSSGVSSIIGTYNNITSAGQSCFFSSNSRHRIQYLVTKAELNAAGISAAADLSSLRFRVVTKNSTQAFSGFTVSLANTATTSFSNFVGATFTQVYSGSYTTVAGLNTISFSSNFAWDGVSNIVVNLCFQNASAGSADDILESDVPNSPSYYSVYGNYTTGATTGCSLPGAFISALRPNLAFGYAVSGTGVSTLLSSSNTAYLGPYDDVYFYDGTGNILARIRNLGAFDYGCTQVVIDRAGSSSVAFWNTHSSNYLASKSFRVIPTNNSSTGNYQVSFYYSAAEINNWAAATGQSFANAQVVKVSNGFYIPDVTPTNKHVSDITLSSNTSGTFGTGFIATGNFSSTGFSGFGIGVVGSALPITINYFNGTKQAAGNLLNWKVNCSTSPRATMTLERSGDGRNFSAINTITADAVRCNLPFSYTDASPMPGRNYYRLKAADADGKLSYSSQVVLSNILKNFEIISIAPNPVVDGNIKLQITSSTDSKMEVFIVDMKGRLLKRQPVNLAAGSNTIPMDVSNISAGTYNVYGSVGGERSKLIRLIKQ